MQYTVLSSGKNKQTKQWTFRKFLAVEPLGLRPLQDRASALFRTEYLLGRTNFQKDGDHMTGFLRIKSQYLNETRKTPNHLKNKQHTKELTSQRKITKEIRKYLEEDKRTYQNL